MKKHLLLLSLAASAVLADTFTLGQINVLNTPIEESPFEQTMTSETIAQQNSENLPSALDNMSGVSMQMMGGGRNEGYISIRGQDFKRVGVYIDGIPVYVPYDGNFDANRFLTGDIAQIDVAKGFSSVAYGSNTLGGVINIITKKPTKALEGDIKVGMVLDSDIDLSRKVASLNLGTRQDHIYAQLSASYADQSHFRLSDDFIPVTNGLQHNEDRLRSATSDHKVNLKTGYIADDGSEIAIGYSNQKGEKQVSPSATVTSLSSKDKWTWPYWDKETLYITGQKNIGNAYLKSTAYYDKSQNSLDYNYLAISNGPFPGGSSRYDDYAYGGRLEYGTQLSDHFLTASANYKKDVHRGYQINEISNTESFTDRFKDHTISLGIEDVYTLSSAWQILGGVGYDRKTGDSGWDAATGNFPMGSQDATSPEAAVIFAPDATSKIRVSIAQKTYLPSMKDRYTRTVNGLKEPNPDLGAETATHYELSYQKQLGTLTSKIAGFYSRVQDTIQSVTINDNGTPTTNDDTTQNQNVGTVDRKGIELDINYKNDRYEAGGNYSYITSENKTNTASKITDVPKHKIFAYGQINLGYGFSLYGDIKYRDGAYESATSTTYMTLPSYTVYDFKTVYKATANITAEVGIKNLTDELIVINNGYPLAGREYFANLSYKF